MFHVSQGNFYATTHALCTFVAEQHFQIATEFAPKITVSYHRRFENALQQLLKSHQTSHAETPLINIPATQKKLLTAKPHLRPVIRGVLYRG